MKCLQNRIQDSNKVSDNDSAVLLSWSPLISESDRPFLLTAIVMLKFGFPEVNIHIFLSKIKIDTLSYSQQPPTVFG